MQRRSHKNKVYSAELKIQAVEEYLSGKGSQREVCRKYGILAKRTLEVWIMWYKVIENLRSAVAPKERSI